MRAGGPLLRGLEGNGWVQEVQANHRVRRKKNTRKMKYHPDRACWGADKMQACVTHPKQGAGVMLVCCRLVPLADIVPVRGRFRVCCVVDCRSVRQSRASSRNICPPAGYKYFVHARPDGSVACPSLPLSPFLPSLNPPPPLPCAFPLGFDRCRCRCRCRMIHRLSPWVGSTPPDQSVQETVGERDVCGPNLLMHKRVESVLACCQLAMSPPKTRHRVWGGLMVM